jgi:DNA-binding winged helix-turn-helix (wHTH) protein
MRYAPNDTPYTGKGHWTWPLTQINDQKTIKQIVKRGIQLQTDISDQNSTNTDQNTSNPQMLWETFKVEIRKIAKSQNKKAYHRMSTKI